jgi:transglutaminase-like putative cysteine protease
MSSWVSLVTPASLPEYLRPTRHLDHDHPTIRAFVEARGWGALDAVGAARAAFTFVRDEVQHSWDVRSHRVTRTASEVLVHREGLCYAKSHLLAALLRHVGVPSGLAYQRLTSGDTAEAGYITHGLNTVFLEGRWTRLDARGNKPGVQAEFSLGEERLAFAVRPEMGERDYDANFSDVHPTVARALGSGDDLYDLIGRLPDEL